MKNLFNLTYRIDNFCWYLARAKKIHITEYPYRINQLLKKQIDKFFIKSSKWINCIHSNINIKKADISEFEKYFSSTKLQVINNAEKILNHKFNIFGIEKYFGNQINWHLDPKTNNSWPLKFWGDINYRDGKTIGGIKFAWELNRLQHFPKLAIAYSLTGSKRYKDEIFRQLESWIESNPYPKGINWIMGIELGIRVVNIIYTLKFLGVDQLTSEEQKLVNYFMFIHGRHLYRYPSKYSSCANHAIAEALGLFLIGLCFPGIKNAHKWKKFGKKVLEREITRQIYPDGSSFEHSIHYLQFVVDHFLIYYLFCKEYGESYS
ncbi:MAG: heparinase II/III family protein, partial [Promethearchaeota archaeon]